MTRAARGGAAAQSGARGRGGGHRGEETLTRVRQATTGDERERDARLRGTWVVCGQLTPELDAAT